ncbi:unnamed protein product [Wuchereria bancrofti]|uniref:Uncharacterized protein n=1 Tax=Wuchereria bancrofti TaxID=6293 RepID=A0A3P7FRH3_WUCBA|nr:unnamed protein product [Wuchereria bancrofti]
MEYCCKGLYTIKRIKEWREKNINDLSFRRGYEVGSMFVKRIWYEETLTLRFPAILLITLAYFYSQSR